MGATIRDEGRETRGEGTDVGEAVAPVSDGRTNGDETENAGQRPALLETEGAPNAWPDESAESAMLSELRERGEKPAVVAATEAVEEIDSKNLPPLNELVQRLSPAVRETLDDLFRARFVRVARVPQKALTK